MRTGGPVLSVAAKIAVAFLLCLAILILKYLSTAAGEGGGSIFCQSQAGRTLIALDIESGHCGHHLNCVTNRLVRLNNYIDDTNKNKTIELNSVSIVIKRSQIFPGIDAFLFHWLQKTFPNIYLVVSESVHVPIDFQCRELDEVFDLHAISSESKTLHRCLELFKHRKLIADCLPSEIVTLPLLLTSVGGGGTHSISNLLKSFHIDTPHEELGTAGSVAWQYAINERAVPHVDYPHHAALPASSILSPRFAKIFQITRCPIKQISSLTSHLQQSYDFMRKYMEADAETDEFLNKRIDLVRSFTYVSFRRH